MLGLKKSSNNNGSTYQKDYHRFSAEEITQVKMLDLRQIMKEKGVRLSWANGQYEGRCPFHEDKLRAPKLVMTQEKGVWKWGCQGGHHGGDTITFAMECHGTSFPRAVEYLRGLIVQVPKMNGNGSSLKEILNPVLVNPVSCFMPHTSDKIEEGSKKQEARNTIERTDDTATFKYGELIYHAKDLKSASKNSLKIILKLIYQDGHFTDRVDLHSARARRGFANQAAERLNLQSAQVEEHLEALMETLEHQLSNLKELTTNDQRLTTQEMTDEEKSQALELLRDPHLLDRMAQDLDKLGYVGEQVNKKLCYLVATSRLLDKPVSCMIRSGSGAGKSALMEQVLSLFPPEDVLLFSRITPQSLFYMGKEALDRKILAIDEREGSQEADYSIRTLQTRGKLTLAASHKDPKNGEWHTVVREFSARTPYMESSTKERINEENLNRCFELYLDESPEQTRRILEAQRKAAAGIDRLSEEEKSHLRRLYQNAQRLLEPIEVRIPFDLTFVTGSALPVTGNKGENLFTGNGQPGTGNGFPENWIRTRRDHERFISLIKVVVLLYQQQRRHQDELLEATQADYQLAKELARQVFGNSIGDMPQPLAQFYELLKKKVEENANGIGIEDFEFTRRQVRTWTGLPDHVVKRGIKALEDLEYVQIKRSIRGSRHFYWLSDCPQTLINTDQSQKVGQNVGYPQRLIKSS